jgi:basic membrane protein A
MPEKFREECTMKKFVALLLAAMMLLSVAAFASADEEIKVALITDVGTITDQSFNQATYEAAKEFCEANGIGFTYFQPATDTDADRIAMIDKAVDEGYNVILMPGYKFGPAIGEVQDEYDEVKFVALDVSEGDLGGAELAENVYCAVYQEELCGYMAGYAAVKLGYKHLGYLGGMAVPAVIRYGFGFVQGCDAAAVELGIADQVTVEYVYGNQFYGDADITAYMDTWYQSLGVEVVFACGGGIYTSAAEAAQKVGGKVIGVDVDQAPTIDGAYGEGMTVTSAMKGLGATVKTLLAEIVAGNFENYGGQVATLGLVGTDPEANYVQIAPSTQFADTFTAEDYNALVAAMFNGEVTVNNAIDANPLTSIAVNYMGNVK